MNARTACGRCGAGQFEPHGAQCLMTRRRYLTIQAVMVGVNISLAAEAVASTALEHPEWDMDEERTWEEWEAG